MKILKKLKIEKEGRLFFVGDVHGEYLSLNEKMLKVNFNEDKDVLIFVGDLVDRGPEIKKVLDLFLNKDCFYGVIGNHDHYMFNALKDKSKIWEKDKRNGSEETIEQLDWDNIKKYSKKLLKKMSLILEIEKNGKKFGIIHAGIHFDNDKPSEWNKIIRKAKNNKNYRMNLIWDRSVLAAYKPDIMPNKRINGDRMPPLIKGIDYLIHGHTTLLEAENFNQRYYIDTFSKKGELTFLFYNEIENTLEFI